MTLELTDVVGDKLTRQFSRQLSNDQYKRFKEALDGEYKVYPTARGAYRVYSYNGEDEEPDQYYIVHPRNGKPQCGCRDFFFRGQSEETDFDKCKHLWRVWLEIYAGLISPDTESPYEWLKVQVDSTLFETIEKLEDSDEEELQKEASQLKALRRYITNNDRTSIDYERAYQAWSKYKGLYPPDN